MTRERRKLNNEHFILHLKMSFTSTKMGESGCFHTGHSVAGDCQASVSFGTFSHETLSGCARATVFDKSFSVR